MAKRVLAVGVGGGIFEAGGAFTQIPLFDAEQTIVSVEGLAHAGCQGTVTVA
jgi:hypothetical protein